MGHGLEAAMMATVVVAAYRHGRRSAASLPDLYVHMDDVLGALPGSLRHRSGGRLDTETGILSWVNAGHPGAPPGVLGAGRSPSSAGPITRPVGFRRRPPGGADRSTGAG